MEFWCAVWKRKASLFIKLKQRYAEFIVKKKVRVLVSALKMRRRTQGSCSE